MEVYRAEQDPNLYTAFWQAVEKAKKNFTLHYAHTSHGSQINSGILALENENSTYGVAIRTSGSNAGLPKQESPAVVRIYDGNPPGTYINPGDYWSSSAGRDRTRAVADDGVYKFSMWSWCGQQSSNSENTVQQYLDTMNNFDHEFPEMDFILMTGHTDGTQDNTNSTLRRNNDLVRRYARQNNKILFDFADIESYDPDGNYYVNTTDACSWCSDWCASHRSDCQKLTNSCAHSHAFNCKLKAKAFWWMMAKLAGWGEAEISPTPTPTPGLQCLAGDSNNDGRVSLADLAFSLAHYFKNLDVCADQNRDGVLNTMDYLLILRIL